MFTILILTFNLILLIISLSNNQRELKEYSHASTEKKCVQMMSFNTRHDQQSAQRKETEHQVCVLLINYQIFGMSSLFQSYLLTTLAGHASVFLWTVNGVSLKLLQSYELKEMYVFMLY